MTQHTAENWSWSYWWQFSFSLGTPTSLKYMKMSSQTISFFFKRSLIFWTTNIVRPDDVRYQHCVCVFVYDKTLMNVYGSTKNVSIPTRRTSNSLCLKYIDTLIHLLMLYLCEPHMADNCDCDPVNIKLYSKKRPASISTKHVKYVHDMWGSWRCVSYLFFNVYTCCKWLCKLI